METLNRTKTLFILNRMKSYKTEDNFNYLPNFSRKTKLSKFSLARGVCRWLNIR